MKITYSDSLHLSAANITRLAQINAIIEEYHADGYVLTLRQLYYQLVSRGIIPNVTEEYVKLSKILNKGRMAGVVDWDAIEDRTRVPRRPYHAKSIDGGIADLIGQYRLDRLRDQEVYIEVWVEKEALSGVISRITQKYHVQLMVNKGYSSASAMHDAAGRFIDQDKIGYLLYLGDHDPSGMDMVRDIGKRLEDFGAIIEVLHIALTDDQIDKYSPPPNPAKLSDPRAVGYIKKYGRTSWEVDALRPDVLNTLIENNIRKLIDEDKYNRILEIEKRDKNKLIAFREDAKEFNEEDEDDDRE